MHTIIPEELGFSSTRLNRMSAVMQRYVDNGQLSGGVAMVGCQGRTVYLDKFGQADIEAGKAVEFDTLFQVASMTKAVTVVAAMMLYEEGYFDLNTPVHAFIPSFKTLKVLARQTEHGLELVDLERDMTFRHLFTHTSGLSYGFDENDPIDAFYRQSSERLGKEGIKMTSQVMIEQLAQAPLAFQPGSQWRYSMAIDVLGYIVEQISGLALDEFFQTRIFEPLGMVDTAYYVRRKKAERLAVIYEYVDKSGKLKPIKAPVPKRRPAFPSGGAGLISTVGDWARFAQMLVNGGELDGMRLLSPRTVGLMEMNHASEALLPIRFYPADLRNEGYGLGLGMRVLMDVSRAGRAGSVGTFGWDGAFGTDFWIDRKESLFGLLLLQHYPNNRFPIHQQFKALVYQAMLR
ncbi:MAG: beta-lactamase family protein [Thermoflexales bacterium]|nr:beta-lactamase family protein [Thermoflexales bacterium]